MLSVLPFVEPVEAEVPAEKSTRANVVAQLLAELELIDRALARGHGALSDPAIARIALRERRRTAERLELVRGAE